MCGIVGYVGKSQAAPILLDGLSKLEYRGYDSAGMAVYDGNKIEFEKAKGSLRLLSEKTHDGESMKGTIGIGHTVSLVRQMLIHTSMRKRQLQ